MTRSVVPRLPRQTHVQPGEDAEPVVRVTNLVKRFGRNTAVDGLTLSIRRGEVFGLLGPNGSGKTTVVNLISGLSAPTSGQVTVLGLDPRRQAAAVRRHLGVVPQETALYDELSAARNLAFHAQLFGVPRRKRTARVEQMLTLAQLRDRRDERVGTFSGGMKRRLAIARAVLHDPAIVYLDEPTLGVDVQARRVIWAHIERLRDEGRTVLITTNYLEEAERICDRTAIIDHGELVALDTPVALTRRHGVSFVEIELDAVPSPRLLARLVAVEGVQEVRDDGARLRVVLAHHAAASGPGAALPRLLTVVAQEGRAVHQLTLGEPSLDEVFLTLTGAGRAA